jgi:hypothetical protein
MEATLFKQYPYLLGGINDYQFNMKEMFDRMKYELNQMAPSDFPEYIITELSDDELLGHAMYQIRQKHGIATGVQLSAYGAETQDLFAELRKVGLSDDVLSKAWNISPADLAKTTLSQDDDNARAKTIREILKPLNALAIDASWYSFEPAVLAEKLVNYITTGFLRRGVPQMTAEGIAKLCAIDKEKIERLMNKPIEESGLTKEEFYRICVALLIVDRELNYRPRGNYFTYKSVQEYVEVDGEQVLANVAKFIPEDVE